MKPPVRRSRNAPVGLLVVGALVAAVVIGFLLSNLAESGRHAARTTPGPAPGPAAVEGRPVTLVIGTVRVQSVGPPAKVRPPVRRALREATQRYIDDAIFTPLRTGRVVNAYRKLFDPGVRSAASKRDRAVLTETRTPVVKGVVHAAATRVRLDALGDEHGKPLFVAATFTLRVNASTARGPLRIRRHTELTFAREFGRWTITAYRVTVRRSIGARARRASVSTIDTEGVPT